MSVLFWLAFIIAVVLAVVALVVAIASHTGVSYAQRHTFDGHVYDYTIKLRHWLPRLTPWHEYAITIGSTIYVADLRCWPALHAHEFKHVEQWHRYQLRMALLLVRGYITRGYAGNWAEQEAMAFAAGHTDEFADVNPFALR